MQNKNDEMILTLIETVVRLEEHVKAISKKLDTLEGINGRLKSLDAKTKDSTRAPSSRAWGD